jgi:hypothetical protein
MSKKMTMMWRLKEVRHTHYPCCNTKAKTWQDGGIVDAKGRFFYGALEAMWQVS